MAQEDSMSGTSILRTGFTRWTTLAVAGLFLASSAVVYAQTNDEKDKPKKVPPAVQKNAQKAPPPAQKSEAPATPPKSAPPATTTVTHPPVDLKGGTPATTATPARPPAGG